MICSARCHGELNHDDDDDYITVRPPRNLAPNQARHFFPHSRPLVPLSPKNSSFAVVIRQLPKGLCLDVLIFYLALRALDTIEDDMTAFKGKEQEKIHHLNTFYKVGLVTEGWSMDGVGEGDERVLLEQYAKCVTVFKSLLPQSQAVIADITQRMGEGMAQYVHKDLGQGTVTVKDYDLYCHFVAGLVGEGLSRLFTCTGYEAPAVASAATTLANTMGLFLQKTNIIRDYLEDYVDGRAFWPQEIWKPYTSSKELGELAQQENRVKAVECLNHLVTNALECVPECLEYLDLLKTPEVFRFCAIPQIMAMATLSELYGNPLVFTGVVKIRKGQAACLILDSNSVDDVHKWFNSLAQSIMSRVKAQDPNAKKTQAMCRQIMQLTAAKTLAARFRAGCSTVNALACWALAACTYFLLGRGHRAKEFINLINNQELLGKWKTLANAQNEQICLVLMLLSIAYIFGYSLLTSRTTAGNKAE